MKVCCPCSWVPVAQHCPVTKGERTRGNQNQYCTSSINSAHTNNTDFPKHLLVLARPILLDPSHTPRKDSSAQPLQRENWGPKRLWPCPRVVSDPKYPEGRPLYPTSLPLMSRRYHPAFTNHMNRKPSGVLSKWWLWSLEAEAMGLPSLYQGDEPELIAIPCSQNLWSIQKLLSHAA